MRLANNDGRDGSSVEGSSSSSDQEAAMPQGERQMASQDGPVKYSLERYQAGDVNKDPWSSYNGSNSPFE